MIAFDIKVIFMCAILAFISSAQAQSRNDTAVPFVPLRPFYIIGHDPDTTNEAAEYLSLGANGLEPDVDVYAGNTNELCIAHGPKLHSGGAGADAPSLTSFLKALHECAKQYTNFALVYFDCKPPVGTAEHGRALLDNIRTNLIGSGNDRLNLIVIISVANFKDGNIFDNIAAGLDSNECVMVDYENSPLKVKSFLSSKGATNICYSNGISFANALSCVFAPNVGPSLAKACKLRTENQFPLVLTWTVNTPRRMRKYIRLGVDGIVVDKSSPWYNWGRGLTGLKEIVRKDGGELGIRLATRADNPFEGDFDSRKGQLKPDVPIPR